MDLKEVIVKPERIPIEAIRMPRRNGIDLTNPHVQAKIEELAVDIRTNGLRHPVVIRLDDNELIDGLWRILAIEHIGWVTVEAYQPENFIAAAEALTGPHKEEPAPPYRIAEINSALQPYARRNLKLRTKGSKSTSREVLQKALNCPTENYLQRSITFYGMIANNPDVDLEPIRQQLERGDIVPATAYLIARSLIDPDYVRKPTRIYTESLPARRHETETRRDKARLDLDFKSETGIASKRISSAVNALRTVYSTKGLSEQELLNILNLLILERKRITHTIGLLRTALETQGAQREG